MSSSPTLAQKLSAETIGTAILVFIGFNATFLPQFLLGSRGMPRRYYNWQPDVR